MTELEKLISLVKYPSKEKKDLISKAYQFALSAHTQTGSKGQSVDPCFKHALGTASILAEIGMGRNTTSAGLLHHVLNDANVSPEKLGKEMGKKVLFLVEGVSKLSHIHYTHDQHHAESFIKFFLGSSQDLRVFIIKLAERLDIMRHKKSLSPAELKAVAKETMNLYVPLAGRLGIRVIQRELEDLSFEVLEPAHYQATRKLIARREKKEHKTLENFRKSLLKTIAKERKITNIETHIRLKSVYSVYTKLKIKGSSYKIYDIKALRINVPTIADCYTILGIIHSHFKPLPHRIKDYIANPKPNGYQSIHTTVVIGNGHIAEIQIRTFSMHEESEYGSAMHGDYKNNDERIISKWFNSFFPSPEYHQAEHEGDESSQKVPQWIKKLVDLRSYSNIQEDLYQNMKFNFPEKYIFVFDPKGVVIDLPEGATVIDFAFALDPKRAIKLCGAKVNKKNVSLKTKLSNNDVVELETKSSAHPIDKWLPFAKTPFAQSSISQYIKNTSGKS